MAVDPAIAVPEDKSQNKNAQTLLTLPSYIQDEAIPNPET